MDPDQVIVVTVTTPPDLARDLAHRLVSAELAACVNVIPEVTSVYRWQGKVQEDQECLLQIKTTDLLFERLKESVREVHPYAVPEIIAIPVDRAFEAYARWVRESVSGATSSLP